MNAPTSANMAVARQNFSLKLDQGQERHGTGPCSMCSRFLQYTFVAQEDVTGSVEMLMLHLTQHRVVWGSRPEFIIVDKSIYNPWEKILHKLSKKIDCISPIRSRYSYRWSDYIRDWFQFVWLYHPVLGIFLSHELSSYTRHQRVAVVVFVYSVDLYLGALSVRNDFLVSTVGLLVVGMIVTVADFVFQNLASCSLARRPRMAPILKWCASKLGHSMMFLAGAAFLFLAASHMGGALRDATFACTKWTDLSGVGLQGGSCPSGLIYCNGTSGVPLTDQYGRIVNDPCMSERGFPLCTRGCWGTGDFWTEPIVNSLRVQIWGWCAAWPIWGWLIFSARHRYQMKKMANDPHWRQPITDYDGTMVSRTKVKPIHGDSSDEYYSSEYYSSDDEARRIRRGTVEPGLYRSGINMKRGMRGVDPATAEEVLAQAMQRSAARKKAAKGRRKKDRQYHKGRRKASVLAAGITSRKQQETRRRAKVRWENYEKVAGRTPGISSAGSSGEVTRVAIVSDEDQWLINNDIEAARDKFRREVLSKEQAAEANGMFGALETQSAEQLKKEAMGNVGGIAGLARLRAKTWRSEQLDQRQAMQNQRLKEQDPEAYEKAEQKIASETWQKEQQMRLTKAKVKELNGVAMTNEDIAMLNANRGQIDISKIVQPEPRKASTRRAIDRSEIVDL